MVAISPPSKVLVTGATGFVGTQTVEAFLREGFAVRGTVRSPSKGQYLDALFEAKGYKSLWEWVIVSDIEADGAFDDAVKGVQGVAHLASPYNLNPGPDPYATIINPAVNGTLSILRSAVAHGDQVKRIVITSSYAAIMDPSVTAPYTHTEEEWNVKDPEELKKHGKDSDPKVVYRASKTLAERAAWDYVKKENPSFDIVTLQPPFVYGPVMQEIKGPSNLNTSVNYVWSYLTGETSVENAASKDGNMVDVRDLANAHVKALAVPEAGGQRFAICKTAYTWQDVLDTMAALFKNSEKLQKLFPNFKPGKTGSGKGVPLIELDSSKSERVLGLKYKSFDETFDDTVTELASRQEKNWK